MYNDIIYIDSSKKQESRGNWYQLVRDEKLLEDNKLKTLQRERPKGGMGGIDNEDIEETTKME